MTEEVFSIIIDLACHTAIANMLYLAFFRSLFVHAWCVCVCVEWCYVRGCECLLNVRSEAADPSTVDGHTRRRCEKDVCPEDVATTCVCSMLVNVRLELDDVEAIHADWRGFHLRQPLKHRMLTDLFPCNVQFGEVCGIQLECPMIGCHCCPCSNARRSERRPGTWSFRRRCRCV